MKKLFFTVTNDLTYDQRMIRICTSLAKAEYTVTLVGIKLKSSVPLIVQPFRQKRLPCLFTRGKAFYVEYNLRLLFFLLSKRIHCICAIDLDTILPCYAVSVIKRIPRVYDAHELFCEMKEVVTRPRIYSFWKRIERFALPKFPLGYTVTQPIADEFQKLYNLKYAVIRNFPVLEPLEIPQKRERHILYQGAVNHGRSFETLIPAMADVDCPLYIFGDGNFMDEAQQLVTVHKLEDKVIFKGKVPPGQLKDITRTAWIGVTIFENNGLSNYLSLGNRFADYIHAGIPQLCVNYKVYRELNNRYAVAVLIDDLSPGSIAAALNRLLKDDHLYATLQNNCLKARSELNWQEEEKTLSCLYKTLLEPHG